MKRLGFIGAAGSLVAVFAASASPIPLYEVYRRSDGLTHSDLALTAVAYFVAVMGTLLIFGRLSDHVGRRPVALAALAITAAGCLVLTGVHGAMSLMAGRVLQGLGCGLASSALAAFVVDTAPATPAWLGTATTTGSPMVGLTIGALGSGVLAEHGPAPRTLVYLVAVGVLAACAALVALAGETVPRARGAIASLRPQVRVPMSVRFLLPAAASTFVATWALGGFYQAFGPSVAAEQLGTSNALTAAVIFASYMAPSALGASFAGRLAPTSAQRGGMAVFVTGVAVLLVALHAGTVSLFIAASLVAGTAQGVAFAGSMRALLSGVGQQERARLLSAIYLLSYCGAAVPSFIAGLLSRSWSLFEIALGYGCLAAIACLVTFAAARDPRPARPAQQPAPA